jgi:hypothetical protein
MKSFTMAPYWELRVAVFYFSGGFAQILLIFLMFMWQN